MVINNFFIFNFFVSVFAGFQIPYPKREYMTDDKQEDKSDANKVRTPSWLLACQVVWTNIHLRILTSNLVTIQFRLRRRSLYVYDLFEWQARFLKKSTFS